MKHTLLLLITMGERSLAAVHERFEVIHAPTPAERAAAVAQHGARVVRVLLHVGEQRHQLDRELGDRKARAARYFRE